MAITISNVRTAVHSGIKASSRKYSKWSRGWTLTDSGVEGLMVAEIAAAVHREQSEDESLLLEVPYATCLQWSGAQPRHRRLETFRGRARADLALFNGNGQTKYIIEVKRTLYQRGLRQDLMKLSDAVAECAAQKDGKLMRAFLAALTTSEDETTRAERWTREFFVSRRGTFTHQTTHQTWLEQDRRFYSICIEIGP